MCCTPCLCGFCSTVGEQDKANSYPYETWGKYCRETGLNKSLPGSTAEEKVEPALFEETW